MTVGLNDLDTLPVVLDLRTAARLLGIGRTKAYELARAGRFPCRILRLGTSYRVPTAELLRYLGIHPTTHATHANRTVGDADA